MDMFGELVTVEGALDLLDGALQKAWGIDRPWEEIPLLQGLGRVAARDLISPIDLPGFARSTVDGYAVRASDTFGASESLPAPLRLVGEVAMGRMAAAPLGPGEAQRIATGGMLPPNADGVVMLEYALELGDGFVEIMRGISPGENRLQADEDLRRGDVIIPKGWTLAPADLGALAGVGFLKVPVIKEPLVGILSTGDEIVPPEALPSPGQVRDINAYALAGEVLAKGGQIHLGGIVPDDYHRLREQVARLAGECRMVLISGGSSVGARDHTRRVMDELGQVLVHGIAIRPGKPTIIGLAGDCLLLGLPGHPVSAQVVFQILGGRALDLWFQRRPRGPGAVLAARFGRNLAAAQGREDYVRVRIVHREGEFWAEPILAQSGSINSLVQAHGLVRIPLEKEGLRQGEPVKVHLFAGEVARWEI